LCFGAIGSLDIALGDLRKLLGLCDSLLRLHNLPARFVALYAAMTKLGLEVGAVDLAHGFPNQNTRVYHFCRLRYGG
jgi:hypothetical protein